MIKLSQEFFNYFKNYNFIYFNVNQTLTLLISCDKYIIRFLFKSNNTFELKVYINNIESSKLFNKLEAQCTLTSYDLKRPTDFLDIIISSIFNKHNRGEFENDYLLDYLADNINMYTYYNELINNNYINNMCGYTSMTAEQKIKYLDSLENE